MFNDGGPITMLSGTCSIHTYSEGGKSMDLAAFLFCSDDGSVGSGEVYYTKHYTLNCSNLVLGEELPEGVGGEVIFNGTTSACQGDSNDASRYHMLTCVPADAPCVRPSDLTGYLRPIEHNLTQAAFNASTACAYGYRGAPVVSACTLPGGEYSLTGCVPKASCSATGTGTCRAMSPHIQCDTHGAICGELPAGLAAAYVLNGTSDDSFAGTYHRILASCNDMPVFQMGQFLLLRQERHWIVAAEESQVLSRCSSSSCVSSLRATTNA